VAGASSTGGSTTAPNSRDVTGGSTTAPNSREVTGGSVPAGRSSRTITVDGRVRTFHLYRPAELADPATLVVMLHGGFGSGTRAEQSYGWDAQADAGHFLVVYPDSLDQAWDTGGGCCGRPAAQSVDDVGFITDMVSAIEDLVPIDHARVFAAGISNGGIMAYTLACRTTVFAAIAADSATMLDPCTDPPPTSVIGIHGTADTRIPYGGGPGQGAGHIDGPAVPAVNSDWRATDRCQAPTVSTAGTVTTSIATCPDGRAVELITIAGAGHQWPGGADKPALAKILGTDPPSTALNATQVIWSFFVGHPGQ
jgi:polyhydroxybutyrate depolymerase